jgi:hypothetical protein
MKDENSLITKKTVFRIHTGFNADPDPDPGPGSQINADPCGFGTWSDFAVTKSWILILTFIIYILYVGITMS